MKKVILFLFLFILTALVSGQEPVFNIYYLNGDIEIDYQSDGSGEWLEVNAAVREIPPGSNIRLNENSTMMLLWGDSSLVSLTQRGTYSFETLLGIANVSGQPLAATSVRFIWQQGQSSGDDLDAYSNTYYESLFGKSRSTCSSVIISPFNGENITGNEIRFLWRNTSTETYKFTVWDKADRGSVLSEELTPDTSITLPSSLSWIVRGNTYYWSVQPVSSSDCDRYAFTLMADQQYQHVEQEVQTAVATLNGTEAMTQLTKAAIYEHNKLYGMAGQCYLNALQADQGNTLISNYYALFLARIGQTGEGMKFQK